MKIFHDQTNQAVITFPYNFNEEQIKDIRRATKYARIEIIELVKEQDALAKFYMTNIMCNRVTHCSKDILIYDFNSKTINVSFAVYDGYDKFNILDREVNSEIGYQDITNLIFKFISKKLNTVCKPNWESNSKFVNEIKDQCAQQSIDLSSRVIKLNFVIPDDVAKSSDVLFQYKISRKDERTMLDDLFEKFIEPVNVLLVRVGRDPSQIESLVFSESIYSQKIINKLQEITGKVIPCLPSFESAVSLGACYLGCRLVGKQINDDEMTPDRELALDPS